MKKKYDLYNSVSKRNRRNGFLFVLPWLFGFIIFFLSPLVQTIAFAFSDVRITTSGFSLSFLGLENFIYALYKSPQYVDNVMDSLSEFAYQVPIIFILGFIIAVVLNSKFKGRTFFRALYFVPVMIATGVVMNFLSGDQNLASMRDASGAVESTYMNGLIDFNSLFLQMGIPSEAVAFIFRYVDQIFDLIWQCGVQIVLFLSGLQSIPEQLYEVSKVEGASKWEEFWYITVPMLGNTIVLVMVFTVIEFCVRADNKVIDQAYRMLLDQQIYGKSSAMLWLYFLVVGAILGGVVLIFNKLCLKKWE